MRISDWSSDVCSSDLKLTSDPEFNPSVEEGEPVSAEAARRRAISILLGNLTVEREGFSYAIRIEYESESPQTAANVANTLADVYIADQVNKKSDATGRATNFLEGQIDQLRAHVQTAERSEEHTSELQSLMRISYAC